ncbi:hypothetical protein [Nocardiopsis metallicus]|uniref:Uncharacterized protein n=1 Tax=Nocardiopsis metallicus TaxID=179819 RepID=A0A840W5V0_9ACTN|nr:hypothetical protein [Nocardiopsis metallicus]MBB5490723.1 hypothetical protein [Nocardiopsis metallicus]
MAVRRPGGLILLTVSVVLLLVVHRRRRAEPGPGSQVTEHLSSGFELSAAVL